MFPGLEELGRGVAWHSATTSPSPACRQRLPLKGGLLARRGLGPPVRRVRVYRGLGLILALSSGSSCTPEADSQ